jgi:hypothetical protein
MSRDKWRFMGGPPPHRSTPNHSSNNLGNIRRSARAVAVNACVRKDA